MKYFLLLVFGCCLLTSASAQKTDRVKKVKQKESVKEQIINPTSLVIDSINVSIYITHHYPYCGGAYPDESEMNNYHRIGNSNFLLVNLETGEQTIVKTDSTGTLNLSLPPGKYGIKEMYKNCTFDEFLQKNPIVSNQNMQNMGEDCYRNWWASYLGEFTVTSPNLIISADYSTYDACFTGNNPCLIYFGPYPP